MKFNFVDSCLIIHDTLITFMKSVILKRRINKCNQVQFSKVYVHNYVGAKNADYDLLILCRLYFIALATNGTLIS